MNYKLYSENGEECERLECKFDDEALKTMLIEGFKQDTEFTFTCTFGGETMTREEILDTAKSIVCGERQDQYGNPEDNFERIADLWGAYLNCDVMLQAADVANMMILLKIARIATGTGKDDNWVDIAGYAACGGEIDGR